VKYALVTFTDNSNITNKFSALTDSAGIFKLIILISSVSNNNKLPSKFELEQNYPNPFSNSTALSYKLKTPSEARITIYDILGREVRRFTTDIQTAGVYKILWNGNNNFGQKVTPGVYFYRLQAGEEAQVKKMVFGTGEQNVFISTPKTYSSQANETIESKSLSILGKTFTVQIVNTDTTSPTIIAKEFSNVAVQSDTTLNFEVSNYIPPTAVFVYSDSTQQFIRGFGAANIIPWRPDMTTNEVYKAFGTGSGEIGMSILRLRVPYNDTEAEFKAQVTTAKLAEYLGAIVFASPWTPPPSLKSNNNIIGGVLKDSSYATCSPPKGICRLYVK
jgi:FlgD Ig-like domain